jgi:thiamine-monophosphate kinase
MALGALAAVRPGAEPFNRIPGPNPTALPLPHFYRFVAYIGDAVPLPEKALIAQIRRLARTTGQGSRGSARTRPSRSGLSAVSTGIGDDCAVLRLTPGSGSRSVETLVTTDFSLEGRHFRRDWHPAESVGHRCLARGLSDIAAMGGDPVAAFLSLALPRDLPQAWVGRFLRGLIRLAEQYGVPLAGGDTAESPNGILADIIVVGTAPKGKAVLRSGARVGDRIYVSGALGGSAEAVARMRAHPKKRLNSRDYERHFYPEPRVELGRILREKGWATAMIDLSDGLSTDLAHICEESGVGAEIETESIPRARTGKPAREVDLGLALHGGEDYELLFTAPASKRIPAKIAGTTITGIGRIARRRKIFLLNAKGGRYELLPRGWEHFRK